MNDDDHYAGVLTGLMVFAGALAYLQLWFFGVIE